MRHILPDRLKRDKGIFRSVAKKIWGIRMSYQLPTFNLSVNIYRSGNAPPFPADVATVGNLALGRRVGTLLANTNNAADAFGGMWLLLPAGTDVRDSRNGTAADTVEVGAGTGRLYTVLWVDDSGGGFSNEHRFAELFPLGPWPTPYPQPAGSGTTAPFALAQNINAGPAATTASVPLNISAPTSLVLTVLNADTTSDAATVSTTAAGSIAAGVSQATTYPTAINGALQTFQWVQPAGMDTIQISQSTPGVIVGQLFVGTLKTPDTSGAANSASSPISASTSSPTSAANDNLIATVAVLNPAAAATYSPPLKTEPQVQQGDGSGNKFSVQSGIGVQSAIGIASATANVPTGYTGKIFLQLVLWQHP